MKKLKLNPSIKTSRLWCSYFKLNPDDIIKTGWNKDDDDYHYSFNCKSVTKKEFDNRIRMSQCKDTALEYQKKLGEK